MAVFDALNKMEPEALAQCAEVLVSRLKDSDQRGAVLMLLHMMEPAVLAQCADTVVLRLEDSDEDVRWAAWCVLLRLEPAVLAPVSYTHLTLPTICSV